MSAEKAIGQAARGKQGPARNVFADDDDGDDNLTAPKRPALQGGGGVSSEQLNRRISAENVFDYDGAYESFSRGGGTSRGGEGKGCRDSRAQDQVTSRYIGNLKAAAAVRDREKERAYERKLLRERESEEGAEEGLKFVTQAYREKLAQDKQWDYEDRYVCSALYV
ncbi:DUF2040 domain-containing protein [archaeon]|nr:MAG: DUF2040 domain-containing protein [archaeon]